MYYRHKMIPIVIFFANITWTDIEWLLLFWHNQQLQSTCVLWTCFWNWSWLELIVLVVHLAQMFSKTIQMSWCHHCFSSDAQTCCGQPVRPLPFLSPLSGLSLPMFSSDSLWKIQSIKQLINNLKQIKLALTQMNLNIYTC